MRWAHRYAATALDGFAAGSLACAVAFAAAALASGLVAALLAPVALFVAFAGLRRIDAVQPRCLAAFELTTIEAPQDEAEDLHDDNVVRLFDPRQLAIARPSAASPGGVTDTRLDAGQALSDALAQLKRSLR